MSFTHPAELKALASGLRALQAAIKCDAPRRNPVRTVLPRTLFSFEDSLWLRDPRLSLSGTGHLYLGSPSPKQGYGSFVRTRASHGQGRTSATQQRAQNDLGARRPQVRKENSGTIGLAPAAHCTRRQPCAV